LPGLIGGTAGLAVGMLVMARTPAVGTAPAGDWMPDVVDAVVAARAGASRHAPSATVAAVLAPATVAEPASAGESEDAPP
jgi:hypothetical protein